MKAISVIIPVFNLGNVIGRAIESVMNQTFKDFEMIIIDDGSTDNSYRILKEYAGEYDNITVYKTTNGGVSKARNLGLQKATGEYIYFLDGDDWIENDMLEHLIRAARETDADIVSCGFRMLEQKNEKCFKYKLEVNFSDHLFDKSIMTDEDTMLLYDSIRSIGVWNRLWRRKLLIDYKIEFPDQICAEDLVFSHIAHKYARIIKTLNYVGYNYIKYKKTTKGSFKYGSVIDKDMFGLTEAREAFFQTGLKDENSRKISLKGLFEGDLSYTVSYALAGYQGEERITYLKRLRELPWLSDRIDSYGLCQAKHLALKAFYRKEYEQCLVLLKLESLLERIKSIIRKNKLAYKVMRTMKLRCRLRKLQG